MAERAPRRAARQPEAVPAVLELDGFSLIPATPQNAGAVIELHRREWNSLSVDIPESAEQVAQMLAAADVRPFALPMLVTHDNRIVAVASPTLGHTRNLTAYFFMEFDDVERIELGLALYLRQVFWTLPLRRLYVQIPIVAATERYRKLLLALGFADEGTLASHILLAGEPRDVAAFGLLRGDFSAWTAKHEPRLSISAGF